MKWKDPQIIAILQSLPDNIYMSGEGREDTPIQTKKFSLLLKLT
jgi:hypothetical protein